MDYQLKSAGREQRIMIAAFWIALASQIQLSALVPGFIIALSPLILPIFLYFNTDLNPIPLTLTVAVASPVFRGILMLVSQQSSPQQIWLYTWADMAFYIMYGLIYYWFYWRRGSWNNATFFVTIVLCDYGANLLEVSILNHWQVPNLDFFKIIFAVALLRTLASCLLAFGYHYFALLLRLERHEQQYYDFIMAAASVKNELYFMQKNVSELERIMKNAYLLNDELQVVNHATSNRALAIARDVHEVKKDYQNVMRGLAASFTMERVVTMRLTEIIRVVTEYARRVIFDRQLDVVIQEKIEGELVIVEHYAVVTILSNLIFNSMDALSQQRRGVIQINVWRDSEHLWLVVADNGPGMTRQVQAQIFTSGFTTKFNAETGDVYRGIGLYHTQQLMEHTFAGQIDVESSLQHGAKFTAQFKIDHLLGEVEA